MAKQEKSAAEQYRAARKARLKKAAKRNKKKPVSPQTAKRIGRAIGVIVVLAVVFVICFVFVNYTGVIEKNTTVLTVGDESISQAEYTYYYNQGFNLAMQYANYGYDIGYDTSALPDAQDYSGTFGEIPDFPEDQTPTWMDFFEYNAQNSLQQIKSAVLEAEALGLTIDEKDEADVQAEIDEMRASASSNGYSLNAYLRASSGKGVDEKLLRKILTEQKMTQMISDNKTEELKDKVSASEVETEFYTNIGTYGVVSYRSYSVNAEQEESKNEDGETVNEVTDKTMKKAKAVADEIAAVTSEKAFLDLVAKAADDKSYKTDDSLTLHTDETTDNIDSDGYDTEASTWLFSNEAVAGATHVKEVADTGYTVYYVTEAVHKPGNSLTYDVRHILVKFPEDETEDAEAAEEAEDAEKTEEETAPADEITVEPLDLSKYKDVNVILDVDGDTAEDKATYQKAQNILQEYLDGEQNEDAFAALAAKYSEDSNAAEGGIYEDVPLGQMVPEFESWAVAKGRKQGDVGIVETDYGYHIMYFVKTTTVPWDDAIKNAIVTPQVNDYLTELAKGDNVTLTVTNERAAEKVAQSLLKSARTQIRNAARQEQAYY